MTQPEPIGAALSRKALRLAADHSHPPEPELDPPPLAPARARWDAIPREFRTAVLDDLEPGEVLDELAAWSTSPTTPPNLLLLGPIGVGKSHAAVAACRPHVDDGATVEFVPVLELLDRLDWRRPDSHAYLEWCCSVDLLIADDLGTERPNEWNGERLHIIVNRRRLDGLPLVATSNIEPTELEPAVGPRTFSRLVGGATVLRMSGRDRRRKP